ncbi:MAG TPA: ABC transporter permease [Patescibacteria group bacterium]|nr:ABC transporter permease [Patescibacteria group bacterium]
MIRYIVRRLLASIPVLLGIMGIVFVLARVIPGDPCRSALGERATDEICAAFIARYGLDQPIPVQFVQYIAQVLTGDLGESIQRSRPVMDILMERLPVTMELTLFALLIASGGGILLGLIAAYRRNSPADVLVMIGANFGVSIPVFVLGLILAYVFAVLLKDTPFALPPSGRLSPGLTVVPIAAAWGMPDLAGPPRALLDFLSNMYVVNGLLTLNGALLADALSHLLLPALALSTISLALIARITRSSLLDVLGFDFVRTARAKGVGERSVVLRHGLRNALLPITTVVGLTLGGLLSGAVLTESIFNLAGVGRAVYEAITGRDYIVIQGFTLVIALVYIVVNLLVDISYAFLDPRVRLR